MLIRSFGWLGAVALVIAPPFIDTDAGKIISIIANVGSQGDIITSWIHLLFLIRNV